MAAGGGQSLVVGVQSLRGLVQNTEPQVVGSVPEGTMRSVPPSASFETRPPVWGSISKTTSPNANWYLVPALVGVTGLTTPPSGALPPVPVEPPPTPVPPRPPPMPPAVPPVADTPPVPLPVPPDCPPVAVPPAVPPLPTAPAPPSPMTWLPPEPPSDPELVQALLATMSRQ